MAKSTQSFRDSVIAWKDGCLSNGHHLTYGEHRCILLVGEKVLENSRPSGISEQMWKIVEGVQLDPLPGVEQIAKQLGVSALDLAFYRAFWGRQDDEVLEGVIYRRVLVSKTQGVPDQVIQDFRDEVDRWKERISEAAALKENELPESMRMTEEKSTS